MNNPSVKFITLEDYMRNKDSLNGWYRFDEFIHFTVFGKEPDTLEKNSMTYLTGGVRHRNDGPAQITVFKDCIEVAYYAKDVIHRENGPAIIEYSIKGSVPDLGDVMKYVETARIDREEFRIKGKIHRLDGPAIRIRKNETHFNEIYLIEGDHIKSSNYESHPLVVAHRAKNKIKVKLNAL